jgi:hypothetical protein
MKFYRIAKCFNPKNLVKFCFEKIDQPKPERFEEIKILFLFSGHLCMKGRNNFLP